MAASHDTHFLHVVGDEFGQHRAVDAIVEEYIFGPGLARGSAANPNVHGQYPGTVDAILIGQKLLVQGNGPDRLLRVDSGQSNSRNWSN